MLFGETHLFLLIQQRRTYTSIVYLSVFSHLTTSRVDLLRYICISTHSVGAVLNLYRKQNRAFRTTPSLQHTALVTLHPQNDAPNSPNVCNSSPSLLSTMARWVSGKVTLQFVLSMNTLTRRASFAVSVAQMDVMRTAGANRAKRTKTRPMSNNIKQGVA